MKQINLKFKYTPEEYSHAVRLHYTSLSGLKRDFVIACITLAFGIISLNHYGYSLIWVLSIALSLIFMLMVLSAYFIIPKIAYKRDPKLKEQYNLSFNEQNIDFKTGKINSKLEWKIYNKIVENKDFFLLYWGKYTFTVIPKRVFQNTEQIDSFRELLKNKITTKIKFVN